MKGIVPKGCDQSLVRRRRYGRLQEVNKLLTTMEDVSFVVLFILFRIRKIIL